MFQRRMGTTITDLRVGIYSDMVETGDEPWMKRV
jgi:hypothetical protein